MDKTTKALEQAVLVALDEHADTGGRAIGHETKKHWIATYEIDEAGTVVIVAIPLAANPGYDTTKAQRKALRVALEVMKGGE